MEDYVTKVQTNVHLIMMEREKKEDNENESSFTFGTLQKKKNLLTTLSAEERDEKAKRERQEEAEVIKTMETSEVDGLIDLTSHKEQFKTRQLAFHYRKGKKCKYRAPPGLCLGDEVNGNPKLDTDFTNLFSLRRLGEVKAIVSSILDGV